MGDKICPNPVRHWLIQGLTLLIPVCEGPSEPSGSGQPLPSAFVPSYDLAVIKTRRALQFAVFRVHLAGGIAEQISYSCICQPPPSHSNVLVFLLIFVCFGENYFSSESSFFILGLALKIKAFNCLLATSQKCASDEGSPL